VKQQIAYDLGATAKILEQKRRGSLTLAIEFKKNYSAELSGGSWPRYDRTDPRIAPAQSARDFEGAEAR
jgi:hypothetical protein